MKNSKRQREQIERFSESEELAKRVISEAPSAGVSPLNKEYLYDYKIQALQKEIQFLPSHEQKAKSKIKFEDLPISSNTLRGLRKRRFITMTEIQRCTLPHSLASRDIIASSLTGSGKTLCYLVPVIETLYRNKWTPMDGLGAIILLPTRELALQVFEVYNSIADFHEFSVGLVIGGKRVEFEKEQIGGMNVLICTPGRLLQHIYETKGFDVSSVLIAVIDEADLMMDLGFQNALQAIINELPKSRQTLLFSATLSKSVQQLSKIGLKSPERVFLHEIQNKNLENDDSDFEKEGKKVKDGFKTPGNLKQYFSFVSLENKLNVLYSFLKSHLKSKIIVFFSTCKQVRFAYETFRKLRVGIQLLELHGRLKQVCIFIQPRRMSIFFTFQENKFSCLFTTNIASRGLDIPKVDWIVQFDCPEDVPTYIHRIGRTARFKAKGNSLLFLQPPEEKFLAKLNAKGIEINKIQVYFLIQFNPAKLLRIQSSLQEMILKDIELKYLAQRAFISYVKSIYNSSDKEVMDVKKIDFKGFSESLGLGQTPVIKILSENNEEEELNGDSAENEKSSKSKRVSKLQKLKEKMKLKNNLTTEKEIESESKEKKPQTKLSKQRKRENQDIYSERFQRIRKHSEDEDDDLFTVKKVKLDEFAGQKPSMKVSNRQLKKIKEDGHFQGQNKLYFDDKGKSFTEAEKRQEEILKLTSPASQQTQIDLTSLLTSKLHENREEDIAMAKKLLKARKQKKKDKIRMIEESKHRYNEFQ